MFLKPFLNYFCNVAEHIILLKETTAIRKYSHHEGLGLQQQVGGACKNNIYSACIQGFLAGSHCQLAILP